MWNVLFLLISGFCFYWASVVTTKSLVEADRTVKILQTVFSMAMFVLAAAVLVICV